MKRLITLVLVLITTVSLAQQTTGNLITNQWTGTIPYTGTGGGLSGGDVPGYNSTTNIIHFGYNQGTAAQVIAINNALQGSGVQISGYNYSWQYYNQDLNRGTLNGSIKLSSSNGSILEQYNYSHPQTTNGWTVMSGTQNFNQQYGLASVYGLEVSFTGKDDRWWAGYYGPMVKDVNVALKYSAATITNPTFGDDTYVPVPLQFGFPFYGKTFTNSWMHSNGVVSFYDPTGSIPGASYNPGSWAYCCGERVTSTRPEFSYIIAPLLTDLYPSAQSTFKTEGTTTYQKYFWNNIGEISNGNNLNTFSLEIRPTGYIGITYDKINIQNQNTWIGAAGDVTTGQINERFWGVPGLNAQLSIPNWSVTGTDMCASNPLSSPTCPGYTDAMCSSNPLYSPSCSGYQQAYFTQQCTIDPLYNASCPGYAQAYHDQQCSISPLYASSCEGYEQAYFKQQCTINPLYNSKCDGYAEAYFTQQCSLNGLYDRSCPNYSTAYATNQLLTQTTTTTTLSGTTKTTSETTTTLSTDISDPVVSTTVSSTTSNTTSQTSPTSVTSTISVIAPQQNLSAPVTPVQSAIVSISVPVPQTPAQQQERQQDQKKTDGAVANVEKKSGGDRKEVAKQVASAAKDAAEKSKNATSLEAQTANQGLVVGLMGYVSGFSAYQNSIVPDINQIQMARQYNKPNVDNRSVQRRLSGANEIKWQEMVEEQYRR